MSQSKQICAFEGRISQFLPGHRACFVTLSRPIGSIKRAVLRAETINCARIEDSTLKMSDQIRGRLAISDAEVAEIVELC